MKRNELIGWLLVAAIAVVAFFTFQAESIRQAKRRAAHEKTMRWLEDMTRQMDFINSNLSRSIIVPTNVPGKGF